MRSNDEFIKNIYKKRDKAVKKRKQKITAAVSGFCVAVVAIVCTSAVTSWVRDKSDVPVKSKSETVDADKRATEIADAEGTFINNSAFEAVPEIGFAPDGIFEGENDDEYMVLTDVYTGPSFGFDGEQEEFPEDTCTEIALETGVFDEAAGNVTDSTRVSYTDEQIADAAYSSLTPEEKEKVVSKTSYSAMVSYEVNVGESYEVWFNATDGGYVKVKLSSPGLERMN